jgi:hypothetical protein
MQHRFGFLAGLVAALIAHTAFAVAPPTKGNDRLGDPLPPGAVARFGTLRLRQPLFTGIHPRCRLLFSADGRSLLSRGLGHGALARETGGRLWEVPSGLAMPWLPAGFQYTSEQLLADGRTLVTASWEASRNPQKGRWSIRRWRWGEKDPQSRVDLPERGFL